MSSILSALQNAMHAWPVKLTQTSRPVITLASNSNYFIKPVLFPSCIIFLENN